MAGIKVRVDTSGATQPLKELSKDLDKTAESTDKCNTEIKKVQATLAKGIGSNKMSKDLDEATVKQSRLAKDMNSTAAFLASSPVLATYVKNFDKATISAGALEKQFAGLRNFASKGLGSDKLSEDLGKFSKNYNNMFGHGLEDFVEQIDRIEPKVKKSTNDLNLSFDKMSDGFRRLGLIKPIAPSKVSTDFSNILGHGLGDFVEQIDRIEPKMKKFSQLGDLNFDNLSKGFTRMGLTVPVAARELTSFDKVRQAAHDGIGMLGRGVQSTAPYFHQMATGIRSVSGALDIAIPSLTSMKNLMIIMAATAGFSKAIQSFKDYDTAVVNTQKVTDEGVDSVKKKIAQLGPELGSQASLMRGYYQTMSAGITNVIQAEEVNITTAKTAKIAHMDQEAAVKGVTAMMFAYRKELTSAKDATDLLFKMEAMSKTEFKELIPIIGGAANVSSKLGISTKEMSAALALNTQYTGSTAEAATQYEAIITALINPTKQMCELTSRYGGIQKLIKDIGFEGVMRLIQQSTGGVVERVTELLGRKEAMQSFMIMSREGFKDLDTYIGYMNDTMGYSDRLWKNYINSYQGASETFRNTIANEFKNFGERIAPAVVTQMKALEAIFKSSPDGINAYADAVSTLINRLGMLLPIAVSIAGMVSTAWHGTLKAGLEIDIAAAKLKLRDAELIYNGIIRKGGSSEEKFYAFKNVDAAAKKLIVLEGKLNDINAAEERNKILTGSQLLALDAAKDKQEAYNKTRKEEGELTKKALEDVKALKDAQIVDPKTKEEIDMFFANLREQAMVNIELRVNIEKPNDVKKFMADQLKKVDEELSAQKDKRLKTLEILSKPVTETLSPKGEAARKKEQELYNSSLREVETRYAKLQAFKASSQGEGYAHDIQMVKSWSSEHLKVLSTNADASKKIHEVTNAEKATVFAKYNKQLDNNYAQSLSQRVMTQSEALQFELSEIKRVTEEEITNVTHREGQKLQKTKESQALIDKVRETGHQKEINAGDRAVESAKQIAATMGFHWTGYEAYRMKQTQDTVDFITNTLNDPILAQTYALEAQKQLTIDHNTFTLEHTTDIIEAMDAAWYNYYANVGTYAGGVAKLSTQVMDQFTAGVGNALAQTIVYGASMGEAFKALMKQVAASIIQSLITMGIQQVLSLILTKTVLASELVSKLAVASSETYAATFANACTNPVTISMAPALAAAAVAAMLAGAAEAGAAGNTAAIAMSQGITAGDIAAGGFHGGIDNVPETSTFLLKKGERVIQPEQNKDLTSFLKNKESNSSVTVTVPISFPNIHNVDQLYNMDHTTFENTIARVVKRGIQRGIYKGVQVNI